MSIFIKSRAVPQRAPCDSRAGLGAWHRRIAVALPLCAAALAMTLSSDVSTAGNASAGKANLPTRLYVITPSSEPAQITGPSVIKIYDPATLTLIKQYRRPVSGRITSIRFRTAITPSSPTSVRPRSSRCSTW